MRLIFITREGYAQPGARIRSYGFSHALRKKGLDAGVFSFTDNLGAKAGKNEVDFSLWEKFRYVKRSFLYLLKEDKCIFIINRLNYHTLPSWLVSKIKKMPFIFDVDDWEAREDIGYYLNLFPRSKAEGLMRFITKNSRICIAASHYLKDYLSRFNKNVYYLPTGVDLNKFNFRNLDNKEYFIFSWHGSINRKEILDYIAFLIDCFTVLRKKYNFIKFVIIGDGIFGGRLKEMIKNISSSDIEYRGWLEPDDIPQYLENTNAGLVPLLNKSRFNLSKFPVKLLEYMALGRPVIASSIGEARYIVKNGYNGFLASNKDEFIYCMEEVIKNSSRVREMGANAYQTVKNNYSLEVLGEKLYNIILSNFK